MGSWKLNASKSKFASEAVIRADTLKFESTTAGIKLTSLGSDPQGKAMRGEYTSHFDGKDVAWITFDHPVHGYPFIYHQKDGSYKPDAIQLKAYEAFMAYFDKQLKHTHAPGAAPKD